MAEGMMGRFSDYTRPAEGIYDPWAVGINAAMGGYQYGMDRAAQERERTFAEQQRGRTRKDWATMDKAQQIAKAIEEKYQLPDEEKFFPDQSQQPGFATASAGVDAVAPGAASFLRGITLPGAGRPQVSPPGAASPAGVPPTGEQPVAPAAGVRAPLAPPAAPQRVPRPFDMRSPQAQRMEADKFRELAIEYQKLDPRLLRDDIASFRERGQKAYAQYVGAATTAALSALTSGDSAGFERWKKMYPDISRTDIDGYALGDFQLVGKKPVLAANGQQVGTNFTLATPDGRQITLDERGIHQFAAQIAQDPQFWASAGQVGAQVTKDMQEYALNVGTQETNAYNAQTNRILAMQQAKQTQLELDARIAEAQARAVGDTNKQLQDVHNMLFEKGEKAIAASLDGAFLPNPDGGFGIPTPGDGSAMTVQIVGSDGRLGQAVDARTVVQGAGKQGVPKVIKIGQSFLRGSVRNSGGIVQPMLSASQAAEYGIVATQLESDMQRGGTGVATLGDGTTVVRTPSPGGWLLWRGRRAQDGGIEINSAPMPYDYDKFNAATSGGWVPRPPPRDYVLRLTPPASAPSGGMRPPSRAVPRPENAPPPRRG